MQNLSSVYNRLDINPFLRMGSPRPLLKFFSSFQTNINTFFTTKICEKCPSSIWCWDSNLQPSEHESPPITNRPGFHPKFMLFSKHFCEICFKMDFIKYHLFKSRKSFFR